ncbi:hypothetical protein BLNAU_24844 [Blattamonas nauphoetae]|uniref:Transposase n=1 Tax=Blattamonas nauphoetae TaxID=2049346 RepID=A0ABQ9WLQ5_9EUKA|nr:hypothetical protein BLNAU_24844 [Blattamonas nauphoetae]
MCDKSTIIENQVLQKLFDDVVGICMDAGTVGGRTHNGFQYVNPNTFQSPILAELLEEDHTSLTIAQSLAAIINRATENGIMVASVVSDSAACMVHSVDLDNVGLATHYSNYLTLPLSWRPFHSHCAAHLLHNAYRDAFGQSSLLQSVHTFVETLVNDCRSIRFKSEFSRKPPRFLAHRWISISSLVIWVCQESMKLTELFPDQFTTRRQFEVFLLYHLIVPLFQSVCSLESDQSSLCDVFPTIFQLLLHYESLRELIQRALAFSLTLFGRFVLTGDPFDNMKKISTFPTAVHLSFVLLPNPSQLTIGMNSELPTEGRRLAAVQQETQFQQTLQELGTNIGEYFETGESEDGNSDSEDEYTPVQREKVPTSTISIADRADIQEAKLNILRCELEIARKYVDSHPKMFVQSEQGRTEEDDFPRKIKRRTSSAAFSPDDVLAMEEELERQTMVGIRDDLETLDTDDTEEYQTCRAVLGETHWRDLLCVQLGQTLHQSMPELDKQSIQGIQLIYLTWLNNKLTLSFEFAFNSDPYTYWKNNRLSTNVIVRTLSTVAVCMMSTSATEALCERVFAQMRTLVGAHRHSLHPQTFRALIRVGSQATSKAESELASKPRTGMNKQLLNMYAARLLLNARSRQPFASLSSPAATLRDISNTLLMDDEARTIHVPVPAMDIQYLYFDRKPTHTDVSIHSKISILPRQNVIAESNTRSPSRTERSQLEERQDVAAKEDNCDEADTLADAIEQLIVRLAAGQDSKHRPERYSTHSSWKAKLLTDEQEAYDTAQEQHFAEQKHQRHLFSATFSVRNVLFKFERVKSAILAKERSLSTASRQLQYPSANNAESPQRRKVQKTLYMQPKLW